MIVLIAAGATTRIESKTNINELMEKNRTSYYSTKMLGLPPIILARKVTSASTKVPSASEKPTVQSAKKAAEDDLEDWLDSVLG
ncbi:hypothetical protein ACROYT_G042189 [Oculina patagonica]